MLLKELEDYFISFHSDFLNSRRKQQRHYYRSKILRVERDLRRLLRMDPTVPEDESESQDTETITNNNIIPSSAVCTFDIVFLEKEMNEMHEKRLKFLKLLTEKSSPPSVLMSCEEYSLSDQEDTYLKKIQLFRLQVELFSLQIQLDSQRLQDEQQIHELGHLIAATNPYPVDGRSEAEHFERRQVELEALSRKNNESLQVFLGTCLTQRSLQSQAGSRLRMAVDNAGHEMTALQLSKAEQLHVASETFLHELKTSLQRSEELNKKVMSEYLVLRHNSRMAGAAMEQRRKDATSERQQLIQTLQKALEDIDKDRKRCEEMTATEYEKKTKAYRGQVVAAESELSLLSSRVFMYEVKKKQVLRKLKKEIRRVDKKYEELQLKRAEDLVRIEQDLGGLRALVRKAEDTVYIRGLISDDNRSYS